MLSRRFPPPIVRVRRARETALHLTLCACYRPGRAITLTELAITLAVLGVLALATGRIGLSAIPAYIAAGILLGPNEPVSLSVVEASEVTTFVAELGVIFLLFFLGLEFSYGRLTRTGRYMTRAGPIDLVINAGLGAAVGIGFFGLSMAAAILAGAIYVSSSALTVKGLIDFRRLADDETDLILAILVFEDLAIAVFLGFSASETGGLLTSLVALMKAVGYVGAGIVAARFFAGRLSHFLSRLDAELLLLFSMAIVIGMSAIAHAMGMSEAIGALMAGVLLADTPIREQLETRLLSLRDLFAALFFFVFGLSIDVTAINSVGWLLALAVVATLAGKILTGFGSAAVTGFSRRQGLNTGAALVAHGEFTIIIADIASRNDSIPADVRKEIVAFAGLYVLATATLGLLVMKQSKKIGRRLIRPRSHAQGPS